MRDYVSRRNELGICLRVHCICIDMFGAVSVCTASAGWGQGKNNMKAAKVTTASDDEYSYSYSDSAEDFTRFVYVWSTFDSRHTW